MGATWTNRRALVLFVCERPWVEVPASQNKQVDKNPKGLEPPSSTVNFTPTIEVRVTGDLMVPGKLMVPKAAKLFLSPWN